MQLSSRRSVLGRFLKYVSFWYLILVLAAYFHIVTIEGGKSTTLYILRTMYKLHLADEKLGVNCVYDASKKQFDPEATT
jgi:hypothetical protein